jgi:hypothetical protein
VNAPDRQRRKRFWTTVLLSVVLASAFGVLGSFSKLVALLPIPSFQDLISTAVFKGVNIAAIAFWIIFPILYCIHVPDYYQSPAALDWERRMKLAEEIFAREAKRRRRS